MSEQKRPQASRGPMGGPMRGMGAVQKATDFKGTMIKLLHYFRKYHLAIVIVLLFAIISTIFSIVSPKIMSRATNQLVDDYVHITMYNQVQAQLPKGTILPPGTLGSTVIERMDKEALSHLSSEQLEQFKAMDLSVAPSINFDFIGYIVMILIGLYLLSAIFSYLQGFIMAGVSQKITFSLREDLSHKINRLPLSYYDKVLHGDVLSRVTNDVDTVSQTLNQSITQLVTSFVSIVGILIMMLTISWQLTLVAICIVPVSFGLIGLIMSRSQKYFKEQQSYLGKLNGQVEESYAGHSIVQVFGAQKRTVESFVSVNRSLYKSAWMSQFFSGLMMPLMNFVGNLGYVAICIIGGGLAINGTLRVGDIQAFIQYVRQFTQPISQLATVANSLQSTAAAAERVFEFLETPEEIAETNQPITLTDVQGEVAFNHVVFGYEQDKTIIKDFNSLIKPGQKIAIVGPTGAGKTTMVNLLMRFYDVDQGSITIDKVNVQDMRRADLRRMFGMVLQDTWLFHGTIRENILYARPDATEEELDKATHAAQVDHFIRSMPGGMDMELNEETSNISQGQKQLLTIARAMLANPAMLILDEATSSVDTRTEVLIKRAMDNLMVGRTSFIIAHRLSTIRDADLILVMKDGNIVEQGTHTQLLLDQGFYAELYNSQFTGATA